MNPITLGALTALWAAVFMIVMLVAAKGKTKLWRWSIWLSTGFYFIAACVFLFAPTMHYPAIYGEWVFDGATILMLSGVTADYLFNINIPPATTKEEQVVLTAQRNRAQRSLLLGGMAAFLIIGVYAIGQSGTSGNSTQTDQTVKTEANTTRAHIDAALKPVLDTLTTIRQQQQTDHQMLLETNKRSLTNERRINRSESQLTTINKWLKQWGNRTFNAIERTRRSIITPAEMTPPQATTTVNPNRVPNRY